ncbi:MAG: hypothetical protein HKN09_06720 [Saprospiraceae bacterium]|nr:hypothetical protein [Saprospiraceae bacterium]
MKNEGQLNDLKIAFVSYRSGSAEIYLMDTDGGSIEQITSSEENNSFPFQIDDRTIGFTRTDSLRNSVKYTIDIYTKQEELYLEKPIRVCAKWQVESHGNRLWAFTRSTDYKDRELFIFDTVTGMEKQLTRCKNDKYSAYSINHTWSSNSQMLAFMSGPDWYTQNIRIYDLVNDSIFALTDKGFMNSGLSWLSDNNTLIANLKIKDETTYEIYSIDIKTKKLQALTEGINLHPDVSPDGEWIVFESQRHGNHGEVYIMKKMGLIKRG